MIITPKEEWINLSRGSEKRVRLQCDKCGKITETSYANYHRAQEARGWSGETLCKPCACKESGVKRRGRPSPLKGTKKPHCSGENSPSWRGGQYISSDGYLMVYVGNDDKTTKWNNYRKKHRVVMEEYLGRKLKRGETIHHIDCDKLNNDIDNLDIFISDKEHRKAHLSLENIAIELFRLGLIDYDRDTQRYVANSKLRELLEQLEIANQQPSLGSNTLEGSETRSESPVDNNTPTSAGHSHRE